MVVVLVALPGTIEYPLRLATCSSDGVVLERFFSSRVVGRAAFACCGGWGTGMESKFHWARKASS